MLVGLTSFAQNSIVIGPFLQDAEPNSITVIWETDAALESTVEWGLDEALGNTTSGSTSANNGMQLHEVTISGLDRFTKYYYKVITDGTESQVFQFKTPPFASDDESFRIIAMSDMQIDGNNPNKFDEIIHDGILDYLDENGDASPSDNIALVMIPGDLVENGLSFDQWKEDFFDPGQTLFGEVPVYPVPGNHENNSVYFFNYFKLPENGSNGFEEHWWFKDYGNTRIIGMDSNGPFNNEEQLTWLSGVLAETCTADSIDFVFAQLHHPHKSELWTPGESDFTGEVIDLLEAFTTDCNKPSIHFFGHTHGYSRGQSRDHKHLWINVATAGGAIDYWGDWPQFDYDEFSVSQDEWGFVSVEVTAGDDPAFTVKRISRGNAQINRDNEITDSLVIRKANGMVQAPESISPLDVTLPVTEITLNASVFESLEPNSLHGQSHWQIATECNFDFVVFEDWKNYENQYNNADTQAGDDLTETPVNGLMSDLSYCWRVRYRDREMNWGNWSEPASFSTCPNGMSQNLLLNPNAELGILNWTAVEGEFEALMAGECGGIDPNNGDLFFAVGGVCNDNEFGLALQDVDVSSFADSINAGNYLAQWGGFLSNWGGDDIPSFKLNFFTSGMIALGSTEEYSTLNNTWTLLDNSAPIPLNTGIIQMELTGTRFAGSDNDSYFDDLFLFVGNPNSDCEGGSSIENGEVLPIPTARTQPNPWSKETFISYPDADNSQADVLVFDSNGKRVQCTYKSTPLGFKIQQGSLKQGIYSFAIMQKGVKVAYATFVVL